MIETIEYKGHVYPKYQSTGNASKYVIPVAREVCSGYGLDIGAGKTAWSFPGSIPVDPAIDPKYDAAHLPLRPNGGGWDYIFSSHCLEHLPDWVNVLDLWTAALTTHGVLFLYLPCSSQKYWLPWNNRKHVNIFTPNIIVEYMNDRGYKNIFSSERDLNHSFAVFGERDR